MGVLSRKRGTDEGDVASQGGQHGAPVEVADDPFSQSESPWAEAQRRYDDRQLRLAAHAKNWQRAFLIACGLAFGALAVAAYAVHLPRLMPVPIEVDQLGRSRLVDSTEPTAALRDRQEVRETEDFITNCRTVLADKMGQRHLQTGCYSRLPDDSAARKWIIEHQTGANDPNVVGESHSVEVTITNSLKISDSTWEVEWKEQSIARDGSLLGSEVRYKGHLTDKMIRLDTDKDLRANPNGYYVETLSWAQAM